MFSGIRLGDDYLNIGDLCRMRLPAKLVTFSGCGTGMNLVSAGDELLGLQRGLALVLLRCFFPCETFMTEVQRNS